MKFVELLGLYTKECQNSKELAAERDISEQWYKQEQATNANLRHEISKLKKKKPQPQQKELG
jgi:hypothetical protein